MMNEPFSGQEKPFVSGFLRGFRAWNIATDGTLRSTAFPANVWRVGQNIADCQNRIAAFQNTNIIHGCECAACGTSEQHDARKKALQALYLNHRPPSVDKASQCTKCGFYAFHQPESVEIDESYVPTHIREDGIFGCIKATGAIVLGEIGFRAERAEVEALCGGPDGVGLALAERYGVPWFQTKEKLVDIFPFTPMEGFDYKLPLKVIRSASMAITSSVPISGYGQAFIAAAGGSASWQWQNSVPVSYSYYTNWVISPPKDDEKDE